jgi:hypothetical protein
MAAALLLAAGLMLAVPDAPVRATVRCPAP